MTEKITKTGWSQCRDAAAMLEFAAEVGVPTLAIREVLAEMARAVLADGVDTGGLKAIIDDLELASRFGFGLHTMLQIVWPANAIGIRADEAHDWRTARASTIVLHLADPEHAHLAVAPYCRAMGRGASALVRRHVSWSVVAEAMTETRG